MSSSNDTSDEEFQPSAEEPDIATSDETDYNSDGEKIVNIKNRKRRKAQQKNKKYFKQQKDETPIEVLAPKKEEKNVDELWASFIADGHINSKNSDETSPKPETSSSISPSHKLLLENFNAASKSKETIFENSIETVKTANKDLTSFFGKTDPLKRTDVISKSTPSAKSSISSLGSALNQLNKKNKPSVLEKSHLDWKKYKQQEGISEELQSFNRGRDG